MFACSHDWFTDLGSQCSHQHHPSFAGLQDASGAYLSRLTAEYPPELAQAITKAELQEYLGSAAGKQRLEVDQFVVVHTQQEVWRHAAIP